MKKNSRIALMLLSPFLLSFFAVLTVSLVYRNVGRDIVGIDWDYSDSEGFKISSSGYLLKAEARSEEGARLSYGNDLVWSTTNTDGDVESHARIGTTDGNSYLYALTPGDILVTASNEKGTVSRSFHAKCYDSGAVLVEPVIPNSQTNQDETLYLGQYDLENHQKVPATVSYTVKTYPSDLLSKVYVASQSENISYDLSSQTVTVLSPGEASFTLSAGGSKKEDATVSFTVVENGVNVKSYSDLLDCTNRSENGETMVLRKNFLSLSDTYSLDADGKPISKDGSYLLSDSRNACFGDYQNGGFDFPSDVYSFETTGNTEYIDGWNKMAKESNGKYKPISKTRIAALHVQKDIYGNGFTLDFHNLTYPSQVQTLTQNNTTVTIPSLGEKDLFRGPLYSYALGDPNQFPVVFTFGQDNIGLYLDGDHILVDDLTVKNADFGSRLENLQYTGTVVEVNGSSNTLKNCRLSSGRTVVRAFSAPSLSLTKCSLSYAYGFLLEEGSNTMVKPDYDKVSTFTGENGSVTASIRDYLSPSNEGDTLVSNYLAVPQPYQVSRWNYKAPSEDRLKEVQSALLSDTKQDFDTTVTVQDCTFETSGFASIALRSSPQGALLQLACPSAVSWLGHQYVGSFYDTMLPYLPTEILGDMAPSKLTLEGENHFYDYKTIDEINPEVLVGENATQVALSAGFDPSGYGVSGSMMLPMEDQIFRLAREQGAVLRIGSEDKVCLPIFQEGGGRNDSVVVSSSPSLSEKQSDPLAYDYLKNPLPERSVIQVVEIAQRVVALIRGFEDDSYYFQLNGVDSQR